jgi:acetylornithine deacetylase
LRANHRDGRILGRGSAGVRSSIAIALAHAPRSSAAAERTPIHLLQTYDEETAFVGSRCLLARSRPRRRARVTET